MPMIWRNQIILLNRNIFPLRSVLDHLHFQHGTSLGWKEPRAGSCAVVDCEGRLLGGEGAFDVGRHFGGLVIVWRGIVEESWGFKVWAVWELCKSTPHWPLSYRLACWRPSIELFLHLVIGQSR